MDCYCYNYYWRRNCFAWCAVMSYIEPILQDITGEELNRGANTAPDLRLDIVARGFWEMQRLYLMSEFAIQIQTDREIWTQTRYSGSTNWRRGTSTLADCYK